MAANITFDGANKLIICNSGTTSLSVKDTYSYWKQWAAVDDNAKYLQAIRVIGGDETITGRYLGSTFFLMNGWQIRPQEATHTLVIDGNLYHDDGDDVVIPTLGNYNVRTIMMVTNLIDTIATGGSALTSAEHAQLMKTLTVGKFVALQ